IGFALMYLPAIVSVGLYFEQKRAFAMGIAVPLPQEPSEQRRLERKTCKEAKCKQISKLLISQNGCTIANNNTADVESILPDVTIEKSPVKSFLNQIIEQIDIKLLKNAAFTLFAISNFLTSLGFNAVYNYADDLANDSKVIKDQRTYIVMAIGLSNIFGRLIIGYLGDRKWVNRLFFFILTVIISGVATIMAPLCGSSVIPHIGYASFFGFFSGGYVTLTAIVLVDIVGINKLSDAFGVLLLFIGVATAIGTPVVGAMRDTFSHFARPFLWPYIICGGCTVLSEKPWFKCQFHDVDETSIKKPDEFGITEKDYAPLLNINKVIVDRIQGSLFGLAVGDALGAHVEFRPHDYLVANPVKDLVGGGTWGLARGQFTDDTSMALCLAISLIARQDFVAYDQLVRYKWWYQHGYMSSTGHCFDIGAASKDSIVEFEKRQKIFSQKHNIPLDQIDFLSDRDLIEAFNVECSRKGVAGNGALMRLVPVPIFFFRDPVIAVEYSGVSGKITHGDDKVYDVCCYYGALIIAAFNGIKKEKLLSEKFYDNHLEWFGGRTLHPEVMAIVQGSYKTKAGGYKDGIRGKGYIINALEAALWAFWTDNDCFEKGALNAVNLGDDTDTTAAIYGQLAGAYYGYEKLPTKWLDSIYAKNFLLCVSSWIAYEGEKWSINQKAPDTDHLITFSNGTFFKSMVTSSVELMQNLVMKPKTSLTQYLTSNTILRKAIDSSGHIGYFYDGWQDSIIKSPNISLIINEDSSYPPIKCVIKSGKKLENRNILRRIDFPGDLRLSVLSNLVKPAGIALVVDYPFEIDECTRIFYYSYLVRKEAVIDEKSIQKQEPCKIPATHIITAMDSGIDVLVLMTLPADDPEAIDASLDQIRHCLKHGTQLTVDENALNRITPTYVYSNVPHLAKQTKITDVYREICRIKNTPTEHQPCNYILTPIRNFCSGHNQQNTKFVPIEPRITTRIEDYWLRFSTFIKIWTIFENKAKSDVWQTDLKEQFGKVREIVSELMNQYDKQKKQAQSWIKHIRQAKELQETIEQRLRIEEEETKLKRSIEGLKHEMRTLEEKHDFIKYLEKNGFEYWNAKKRGIKQGHSEDAIQKTLIQDIRQQRILCSDDTLNAASRPQFKEILSQMLNEQGIDADDDNSDFLLRKIKSLCAEATNEDTEDYSCSYWHGCVRRQGYLYLSVNYLYFHSDLFGKEITILIKFADIIVNIATLERTHNLVSEIKHVCTRLHEHNFEMFRKIEETFQIMEQIANFAAKKVNFVY
ncbi:unnamed protein product, partial [Rotaria sp. Silwood2]